MDTFGICESLPAFKHVGIAGNDKPNLIFRQPLYQLNGGISDSAILISQLISLRKYPDNPMAINKTPEATKKIDSNISPGEPINIRLVL